MDGKELTKICNTFNKQFEEFINDLVSKAYTYRTIEFDYFLKIIDELAKYDNIEVKEWRIRKDSLLEVTFIDSNYPDYKSLSFCYNQKHIDGENPYYCFAICDIFSMNFSFNFNSTSVESIDKIYGYYVLQMTNNIKCCSDIMKMPFPS